MKNKKKVYIVVALCIISLFFIIALVSIGRKFTHENPIKARILNEPMPVYVVPVALEESTRFIGANATSEASATVDVSFPSLEIGSQLRILKIFAKVSDRVKKEQVLGILENLSLKEERKRLQNDIPLISSKLDRARRNLKEKRKYFLSVEDLFSKGFATKGERESVRDSFVQAETEVETYQQELSNAKSSLERMSSSFTELKILSPIEGIVLERNVYEGEVTSIGTSMFSIGALSPLYMVADVSQEDKAGIYLGQGAEVSFNFLPGRTFKGDVIRIDPTVNVETQTFNVTVSIPNDVKKLTPGSAAFVRFKAGTASLVIPSITVVGMPDEPAVFVVGDDNKAHLRKVILGMAFPLGELEVINGLKEGERVVSSNLKYLKDGATVSIINNKQSK